MCVNHQSFVRKKITENTPEAKETYFETNQKVKQKNENNVNDRNYSSGK